MLIGDTRGTMAQHPVKVEASAGAGLLGNAPAMRASARRMLHVATGAFLSTDERAATNNQQRGLLRL